MCRKIFTTVVFVVTNSWRSPKCSSLVELVSEVVLGCFPLKPAFEMKIYIQVAYLGGDLRKHQNESGKGRGSSRVHQGYFIGSSPLQTGGA